jgi:hypothetical protein
MMLRCETFDSVIFMPARTRRCKLSLVWGPDEMSCLPDAMLARLADACLSLVYLPPESSLLIWGKYARTHVRTATNQSNTKLTCLLHLPVKPLT